jgi:carbonic anhydrase
MNIGTAEREHAMPHLSSTLDRRAAGCGQLSHGLQFVSPEAAVQGLLIACTDPVLDDRLLPRVKQRRLAVWRNTGPIIAPYGAGAAETEAAIDHAVTELGVKEIAICGHLPGNALRDLVDRSDDAEWRRSDARQYSARAMRRVVFEKYGALAPDELQQAMVEENVFIQLANLRTYPAVLSGLARGKLALCGWIYDAENDELYVHGARDNRALHGMNFERGSARPLPSLDPCDIYLA